MIERWYRGGERWRLSVFAGWQRWALGWWFQPFPSEWTFEVYLGPVSICWWWWR